MIILSIFWKKYQSIWMKRTSPFWMIYCRGQKNFRNELENRGREGEEIALYTLRVLAMERLRYPKVKSLFLCKHNTGIMTF